jgi:hypothetical protein
MTRDEAIQIGVQSLERWHVVDHAQDCCCVESEQFEKRSKAVIDRMTADRIFVLSPSLDQRLRGFASTTF